MRHDDQETCPSRHADMADFVLRRNDEHTRTCGIEVVQGEWDFALLYRPENLNTEIL